MRYIVFDLEWNQSNTGLEEEAAKLPFEIIEIGAVKLDDNLVIISEFNRLVKPVVYHEMHYITSKLIHLQMKELQRGDPFATVARDFLEWCGEEPYTFVIFGTSDLTEFQRNTDYFGVDPISDGPIPYLDVQKLFALVNHEGRVRRNLEYIVDACGIEKDIPFHRAFSDAYYTGKVLAKLIEQVPDITKYISYDVYRCPKDKKHEIKVEFDRYTKYITREFPDRKSAMQDREVASTKCFLCHRNVKKKLRWFTVNGRHYLSVAYCDKHGYLKGKIRFHKTEEEACFAVKTMKLTDEEEVASIVKKSEHAKQMRKRHKRPAATKK